MRFVWISRNTAIISCTGLAYWVLSAFAILRQAIIRFVMFVCPSVRPSIHLYVRMEHLGFHWTNIHEIWYRSIFWKFVKCSNLRLVLLKMGIMMPETCWEIVENKHLIVASCWFSLSLHNLLTMHGHRNLKLSKICLKNSIVLGKTRISCPPQGMELWCLGFPICSPVILAIDSSMQFSPQRLCTDKFCFFSHCEGRARPSSAFCALVSLVELSPVALTDNAEWACGVRCRGDEISSEKSSQLIHLLVRSTVWRLR